MDEVSKTFAPEVAPAESRKWIGRLVIAVVLGAAIWNFLVTITQSLILPIMARLADVDPQSPLYLGKGNIGAPALFAAVVELCFAAMVAAFLSAWIRKPTRKVRIVARAAPTTLFPAAASVTPAAPRPSPPPPAAVAQPQAAPVRPEPPPVAAQPASAFHLPASPSAEPKPQAPAAKPEPQKVEKPAKPKPPKEIYYNLVGDPVDSDED